MDLLQVKQISSNLARRFQESEWGARINDEVSKYENEFSESGEYLPDKEELNFLNYNSGPFAQFYYVCGRTFKNLIRNPRTSFLQVSICRRHSRPIDCIKFNIRRLFELIEGDMVYHDRADFFKLC